MFKGAAATATSGPEVCDFTNETKKIDKNGDREKVGNTNWKSGKKCFLLFHGHRAHFV